MRYPSLERTSIGEKEGQNGLRISGESADQSSVIYKIKLRVSGPDGGGSKAKFSVNLEDGQRLPLGSASPGMSLHDPSIAAEHCVLQVEGGELIVEDTRASESGISVNNHKSERSVLKPGDLLQMGVYSIEILEAPYVQGANDNATQFVDLASLRAQLDQAKTSHQKTQTQTYHPSGSASGSQSSPASVQVSAPASVAPEAALSSHEDDLPAAPDASAEGTTSASGSAKLPEGRPAVASQGGRVELGPVSGSVPSVEADKTRLPFYRHGTSSRPLGRFRRGTTGLFSIPSFPLNGRAIAVTVALFGGVIGAIMYFSSGSGTSERTPASVKTETTGVSGAKDATAEISKDVAQVPKSAEALLKKANHEFPLLSDAQILEQALKPVEPSAAAVPAPAVKDAVEPAVKPLAPVQFPPIGGVQNGMTEFEAQPQAAQAANSGGAVANSDDSFVMDQLVEAIRVGNVGVVRDLIGVKGVSTEVTTKVGSTPLLAAAAYGQTEVVKYLLSRGANINARDRNGTTALMWAVYKGNIEIAKLMIQSGADQTLKRDDGDRAIDIAKRWGRQDLVALLSGQTPQPAANLRQPAREQPKGAKPTLKVPQRKSQVKPRTR